MLIGLSMIISPIIFRYFGLAETEKKNFIKKNIYGIFAAPLLNVLRSLKPKILILVFKKNCSFLKGKSL